MKTLKRLGFISSMAAAVLFAFAAVGQVQAGATQEAFVCFWNGSCTQDTGYGKVIWVHPGGKNRVNMTYVLENLTPGNDYQLGFNIYAYGSECDQKFGHLTEELAGCSGFNIFTPGIVTADSSGEAAFHINIKNIVDDPETVEIEACGDYEVIFWVGNSPAWNPPVSGTEVFGAKDSVLASFAPCP